jgi:GMP synthase-like glutamine amidotransferase
VKIHYLQHVPFEGLGYIEEWATQSNHPVSVTRLFAGDSFPDMDEFDLLVIMGGPMSVNDIAEYPWLEREKAFIKKAIEQKKSVLGICLGAQLIANVLGSRIYKCKDKEIGWFPIFKTVQKSKSGISKLFPEHIEVFHWHGETFDLPAGCINLAYSAVCENQAFVYNKNVVGLQFHLEATENSISELIINASYEIVNAPYIQTADQMLLINTRVFRINQLMGNIMSYFTNK